MAEEAPYTPRVEPEIWHCTNCGRHGRKKDFKVVVKNEFPEAGDEPEAFIVDLCPDCHESKGLELCNLKTCTCWCTGVNWKIVKLGRA